MGKEVRACAGYDDGGAAQRQGEAALLCCEGERRKQEMEWWRWKAHGVRCGFKWRTPAAGSGQPRRVAWAVSRPSTRGVHAATEF